jgi:hypothetical protein
LACHGSLCIQRNLTLRKGNTMGGYRKLDATGRGKQLEGWFKCDREDCTRAYERVGVPSAGGPHVCHHTNSCDVADRPATSLACMQTSPEALST